MVQEGLQVIEAAANLGEHEPAKILPLQWRCMLVVARQELDSFNTQEILNVSGTSFHRPSTIFLKLFLRGVAVESNLGCSSSFHRIMRTEPVISQQALL